MVFRKHIEELPNHQHASISTYLAGFFLSLGLTTGAFALVGAYAGSDGTLFNRSMLIGIISLLAVLQLVVQVLFFLHVSTERTVRMNLLSGAFTVLVILTIVIGSIWIMNNLDYNMSHDNDIERQMQEEEGIYQS